MRHRLYPVYDSRCGLCSRVRRWMLEQPAHVYFDFVPAGSERAQRLFPALASHPKPSELIVVSDLGEVYTDDAAWIVCLWGLVEYRSWSQRLARPTLRPLARKAWGLLSSNRSEISRILSLESDADLATRLADQPPATCPTGA